MFKPPVKNASSRAPLLIRGLCAYAVLILILGLCAAYLCPAYAAEPLSWVRKPNQPAPAQFDTYHGEALDFRCTFAGFGELPFADASSPRLYYQTNGMGAAWWSLPATVSSNVLTATFPPAADPGADRLSVFFGAPSNAYAAAQVRFRNSPGAHPNNLEPPSVLDWQAELAAATNALVWALTTGDVDKQIKVHAAQNADFAESAYSASTAMSANEARDAEYATYAANLGTQYDYRTAANVISQLDAATETNDLQSAAIAGIPSAITNIAEAVAAEATEGLLTDESDPVWAAQKSQYATTQSVATVSANVGTLWSYVYGNSVWIAVTNYMRTVEGVSPSLQLWEVRDGVTNLVYWSKEEITNVTADLIHDCKTNLEQTVSAATNAMPDKAWAKYQSATGAENPQPGDVTIVSTPSVMLTGGGEWTQYVDVGGSQVFLLQSNGLTSFGADTNGYFRVVDSDGNAQFEIKKTDSYFVGAVPSSVHFDQNHNFVATFVANTQPQLYTSENVAAAEYAAEGGDPNISVSWISPSNGFWSATMEQTVQKPKLFCYAKVLQEGENTIVNTIPARFDGGIRIGNQTYNIGTATISGKTVLTLEAQ